MAKVCRLKNKLEQAVLADGDVKLCDIEYVFSCSGVVRGQTFIGGKKVKVTHIKGFVWEKDSE